MSTQFKLLGSLLTALISMVVLAGVRTGAVDIGDGVVLTISLLILARIAIRTASESPSRRRSRE